METAVIRLPYQAPFAGEALIAFLGRRAIPGVEAVRDGTYSRSLRLPPGPGTVILAPANGYLRATFRLSEERDLATAIERSRALLDLDSDPRAVAEALSADARLAGLVRSTPGLRVPGCVDAAELALRAVLGQQVTLRVATSLATRLVRACGEPLRRRLGTVTHLFPSAAAVAAYAERGPMMMPAARRRALGNLARVLGSGQLTLDGGADRVAARRSLLELPGIGPWTVAYRLAAG